MICTIVLTYTLIMFNGDVLPRVKYFDDATYQLMSIRMSSKKWLEEAGVKEVKNFTMKTHEPFNCATLKKMENE